MTDLVTNNTLNFPFNRLNRCKVADLATELVTRLCLYHGFYTAHILFRMENEKIMSVCPTCMKKEKKKAKGSQKI